MIDVDSDDESLSALSDDDYGNFITIDEADNLACNHSMHACMADMGDDGAPNDDEDGPGAPTTDTGAGQCLHLCCYQSPTQNKILVVTKWH